MRVYQHIPPLPRDERAKVRVCARVWAHVCSREGGGRHNRDGCRTRSAPVASGEEGEQCGKFAAGEPQDRASESRRQEERLPGSGGSSAVEMGDVNWRVAQGTARVALRMHQDNEAVHLDDGGFKLFLGHHVHQQHLEPCCRPHAATCIMPRLAARRSLPAPASSATLPSPAHTLASTRTRPCSQHG